MLSLLVATRIVDSNIDDSARFHGRPAVQAHGNPRCGRVAVDSACIIDILTGANCDEQMRKTRFWWFHSDFLDFYPDLFYIYLQRKYDSQLDKPIFQQKVLRKTINLVTFVC